MALLVSRFCSNLQTPSSFTIRSSILGYCICMPGVAPSDLVNTDLNWFKRISAFVLLS